MDNPNPDSEVKSETGLPVKENKHLKEKEGIVEQNGNENIPDEKPGENIDLDANNSSIEHESDNQKNEKLDPEFDKVTNSGDNIEIPNDKYEPSAASYLDHEQLVVNSQEELIQSESEMNKPSKTISDDNVSNDDHLPLLSEAGILSPDDLKEGDVEDKCLKQNMEDNVEPSKNMEDNVEPSKNMEDNVEPSKNVEDNVEPSKNMEDNVEPSKNMEDNLEPSKNMEDNLEPSKNMEDNVEPSKYMEDNVEPSKKMEDNVEPSKYMEDNVEPSKNMEDNVEPSKNMEDNVEPSKYMEDNVEPSKNMEDNLEPSKNVEDNLEPSKEEDEWLDILGSGQLKRKVLKKGNGAKPVNGDIVTVSSEGRLSDGTVVDIEESFTFTLGDGDVIPAWDLGVSLMEVGEIIELITDARFAYGSLGRRPDIPKDATITYRLELLKKDYPLDFTKLSLEERMAEGEKKRERGNYHFSRLDHTSAMSSYNKALKILDLESFSDAGTGDVACLQKILDSRVKCYNNLAACQLKVEAYDMVIKSCSEVLNIQSENVKALFRMGKAYAGKGNTKEAVDLMKKALKLEPETKILHQELSKLTKKLKVETQSVRNMYKKMLGTPTSKVQKPIPQSSNMKWIGVAGAVTAVLVSVGLAAYRFGHS